MSTTSDGSWSCPYCTFINEKPPNGVERAKCSMCDKTTAITPTPPHHPPSAQSGSSPQASRPPALQSQSQPQSIPQGPPRPGQLVPQYYHPNQGQPQVMYPHPVSQYFQGRNPPMQHHPYPPPGPVMVANNPQQQVRVPAHPQVPPLCYPQASPHQAPSRYYPQQQQQQYQHQQQQPPLPIPSHAPSPTPNSATNPFAATQGPNSAVAQQFFAPAHLTSDGLNWVCPQCRAMSPASIIMCRGCRYSPPYFVPPTSPQFQSQSGPNVIPTIQTTQMPPNPFALSSPQPQVQAPPANPSSSPHPIQNTPHPPPSSNVSPTPNPYSLLIPNSLHNSGNTSLSPCSPHYPSSPSRDGASSPRLPDDALLSSKEMSHFVCNFDTCGLSFTSLDLFTEHMALHIQEQDNAAREEKRKMAWYKEGYTGQYRRALQVCYQQHQISEKRMLRMLEDLEKNIYKADVETRTKGMVQLLKEMYSSLSKCTCITSTGVDHYFTGLGDAGWGCGYRNIQMMCSYLMEFPTFKKALFNNLGYIPGVIAIQEAIENCWKNGFDPEGAKQFGGKLRDTKGMIGATDAAALFRSFGIKMDVIDFYSKPLDPAVIQAQQEECANDPSKKVIHYEPNSELLDWVWNYYNTTSRAEKKKSKFFSKKFIPPLFLQHPGHSRTIVGVERNDKTGQIALLIFDPAHIGEVLKHDLKNGIGINRFRKLLPEFTHANYQIGVIRANELLTGEDYEKAKLMDFASEQMDDD